MTSENDPKRVTSHTEKHLTSKPNVLIPSLSAYLSEQADIDCVLHDTADALKTLTCSASANTYIIDNVNSKVLLTKWPSKTIHHSSSVAEIGFTLAAYVYRSKKITIITEDYKTETKKSNAVMCVPIMKPNEEVVAVIELRKDHLEQGSYKEVKPDICLKFRSNQSGYLEDYVGSRKPRQTNLQKADRLQMMQNIKRNPSKSCFVADFKSSPSCSSGSKILQQELKMAELIAYWMGTAIHQHEQCIALRGKIGLNNSLLDITRKLFGDSTSFEEAIDEIMRLAKNTSGAKRGNYWESEKSDGTSAIVYTEGIEPDSRMYKKKAKGNICEEGTVRCKAFKTRKTVYVPNLTEDKEFYKEEEDIPGVTISSIVCIPIFGTNLAVPSVIGIMSLINIPENSELSKSQEATLSTFPPFCSLLQHVSSIRNKIEQHVTTHDQIHEILLYHMEPCPLEVDLMIDSQDVIPDGCRNFSWYPSETQKSHLAKIAKLMFREVLGDSFLKKNDLNKFLLMVQRCYRNNPYHNFEHAFCVTHCMFNILIRNRDIFSGIELQALMIAALCHDVDHPGHTGSFLLQTNHPLSILYKVSPLESHHYQITVLLLERCKIFSYLERMLYKKTLKEIHDLILATDLNKYFHARECLVDILSNNNFDWTDITHRTLMKNIIMTTSDLSGQAKPFCTAKQITSGLYQEFYDQGDLEKAMGLEPLSMLDRNMSHMQPSDQIQFLSYVCLPCSELLLIFLPNTKQINQLYQEVRLHWRQILAEDQDTPENSDLF